MTECLTVFQFLDHRDFVKLNEMGLVLDKKAFCGVLLLSLALGLTDVRFGGSTAKPNY